MAVTGGSPRVREGTRLAALALAYFVCGRLGLELALVHPSASAVWPPAGVALAALLAWGRRLWPGVWVGALLVNVTTGAHPAAAVAIACGNTLEALAGAWLVERFAGGRAAWERPSGVLLAGALAGICATAIAAVVGPLALAIAGDAQWEHLGGIALTWWLGDAGGVFLVAPFLLLWSRPPPLPRGRRALEAACVAALFLASAAAVFGGLLSPPAYPLAFLNLPALLWCALRFGLRATTAALVLLAALAVAGTLAGSGPFVFADSNLGLLMLQAFLATTSATVLCLAASVVERRRAYAALEGIRAELERSNAELERFAYVVSHDLQEPLRAVVSAARRVSARHGEQLDPQARELLELACRGAERAHALVRDLLVYARVGFAREREDVGLAEALEEALANLGEALRESGAEVRWGALPRARCSRGNLVQLFQNLVGNALKFRGPEPPRIQVSAEPDGAGGWCVGVRDNGIGIPPEDRERVFQVFERGRHGAAAPGSGIGLAIVQRVVEQLGGRVWAEGAPGAGVELRFTLPARGGTRRERAGMPDEGLQ